MTKLRWLTFTMVMLLLLFHLIANYCHAKVALGLQTTHCTK